MEQVRQHIDRVPDVKAGVGLIGAGTGGSFLQAATEYANLAVAMGNGIVVLGGAVLLFYKIKEARRKDRRLDD